MSHKRRAGVGYPAFCVSQLDPEFVTLERCVVVHVDQLGEVSPISVYFISQQPVLF